MTDWLNVADRWRERQRWLPAWLDDADWKSWLLHAAITVALGTVIGWTLPLVSPNAGRWFMVLVYGVREILNRTAYKPLRFDWRYKPLDGVMDVAAPALAAWALS